MLTPQQVADKTFSANDKRTTGYDMQEVDSFLDQITSDYASLYSENAELRSKLKLLADKINEYRETENAIRATLYTAQKTANGLVTDAQQKREEILDALENDIRARKDAYDAEIQDCHDRLAAARQQTADYVASVREIVAQHQHYLDALPEEIVGGQLTEDYEADQDVVQNAQQAVAQALSEDLGSRGAHDDEDESDDETNLPAEDAPKSDEGSDHQIDFSNLRLGRDFDVK